MITPVGKQSKMLIAMVLCCGLLLAGCGTIAQNQKEQNPAVSEEAYYVTEIEIPDPDKEFSKETVYKERAFCTVNHTVYRLTLLTYCDEENSGTKIACGIQILEAPYEKWQTYVYGNDWVEGQSYSASNICVSPEGEIWVMLSGETDYYLAQWTDGRLGELQKVTEEFSKFDNPLYGTWEMDQLGNHYFYSKENMISYDSAFKERKEISVLGTVEDIFSAQNGEAVWKGKKKSAVYSGVYGFDGDSSYIEEKAIKLYQSDMVFDMDKENQVIASDSRMIWKLGAKKRLLCSFVDSDVYLDEVKDLNVLEDDSMLMLASEGDVYKLLTVEKGIDPRRQNKQEIVITAELSTFINRCIVEFNKQNSEYYVTLRPWLEEEVSYQDYCTGIQLEFSAGKGPDLVSGRVIDLSAYAQNGYLVPLEEYLRLTEEDFYSTAMEVGKIEGVAYGVPYAFTLETMLVDKAIADGRASWTLQEFVECAQSVQPETLLGNARAWDILYFLAFWDEEASTFVDWKKGECHFDSTEFIELLKFARQHADKTSPFGYSYGGTLKSNKRMALCTSIYSIRNYLAKYREYGEDIVFIGYPALSGSGSYISGDVFAINSHSKNKEGAAAFLQYLLSEEAQNLIVDIGEAFPVKRNALTAAAKKAKREDDDIATYRMTDSQEQAFWSVLYSAKPKGNQYQAIIDILFEETGGFFEGDRSAEEVAKLIQNRVQLYLDENQS